MIISQPSPVPGALLTSEELADPARAAAKKAKVLGKTGRTQPEDKLKFRLDLPGNKGVGGQGKWSHGASEEEMESLRRGVLTPYSFVGGSVAFENAEGAQEGDAEEEDVEMGDAEDEALVAVPAQEEEEVVKVKKEKSKEGKEKKSKKKDKGVDGEKSSKKKKVKAEE